MENFKANRHEATYPGAEATVLTFVECENCGALMVATEYDSYHESQEYECDNCGNMVHVYVPVSGDCF